MNLRQKPNGVWLVDYEDERGERRRVSTGTKDKGEARLRARDIVLGIDVKPAPASPQGTGGSRMTMAELFRKCELTVWKPSECRSQKTIKSNLKILCELIGDVPVQDMTAARIKLLAMDLEKMGYAPATVKRKLDSVGRALSEATAWEDAKGKPLLAQKPKMPSIKISNFKNRVLEPAEEEALFACLAARRLSEPTRDWHRYQMLIRFLLDTGCRLGEAMACDATWFETADDVTWFSIPAWAAKNSKPRQVPLTAAILADLPALLALAGEGKLWPYKGTFAWYRLTTLREDMKAEGHDIDDVTLHTFRHTCLTRLARDPKVPLHLVSLWAGHSSIQITMSRYAHLRPQDLLGALASLNRVAA